MDNVNLQQSNCSCTSSLLFNNDDELRHTPQRSTLIDVPSGARGRSNIS